MQILHYKSFIIKHLQWSLHPLKLDLPAQRYHGLCKQYCLLEQCLVHTGSLRKICVRGEKSNCLGKLKYLESKFQTTKRAPRLTGHSLNITVSLRNSKI